MIADWTKSLKTEQEKEEFRRILITSTIIKRLQEMLLEYEASLDRAEISELSFDKPNWAYRQAYKNGYRACLTKMKELVNLDNRGTK